MLKIPLYHLVQGGGEGSLTRFRVVVCSGPVLEVKRPFTTEQSEHDKHSDDEIAEQKTCNKSNTSASPNIR